METGHCTTCTCGTGGVIRWRPVVAVLLFMSGWDTIGLLLGERVYASPSYDVLRDAVAGVTFAGVTLGLRVYGITLLIITGVVTWALLAQRYQHGRMSRSLRLGLSCLAAYWVSWCFGIVMTYLLHAQVYAWGAIGKLVGIAAIAVLAARVPPPHAQPKAIRKVNRAVPVAVAARPGQTEPPRPSPGP